MLLSLRVAHSWASGGSGDNFGRGIVWARSYCLTAFSKAFIVHILNIVFLGWGNPVLFSLVSDWGYNHLSNSIWGHLLCWLTGSCLKVNSLVGNSLWGSLNNSLDNSTSLDWLSDFDETWLNSNTSINTHSLSSESFLLSNWGRNIADNRSSLDSTLNISLGNWADITTEWSGITSHTNVSALNNILSAWRFSEFLLLADSLNGSLSIKSLSVLLGLLFVFLELGGKLLVLSSDHRDVLFAFFDFVSDVKKFRFHHFVGTSYALEFHLTLFHRRGSHFDFWV